MGWLVAVVVAQSVLIICLIIAVVESLKKISNLEWLVTDFRKTVRQYILSNVYFNPVGNEPTDKE